ncbi:PREDICTED: putative OPA3-like protein CG13603 [Cyphomyrmex costatus]|uniref:putative OPA3-like protein CG13603 n=1 Tax=Cyphomyrmex costatus TaxID=456900 RepID=UPI000852303F|nr:PREDICTED: putative OPA3-like protein CG13603 [Cyphomyrmex costatus]
MIGQGFPGANLIGQLLSQITQPLSKAIVKRAKKRPLLRKYVLIQLGRFYYWCEDMIKWRQISVIAKKRPVDDDRTMEIGTTLLLEALVFGLLGSVLIYETRKAGKRSRVAEQLKIQELNDLEVKKDRLIRQVKDQVILTKQLKEIIVEYSRQVGCTLPSSPEEKGE